jgi:hypothetical protein
MKNEKITYQRLTMYSVIAGTLLLASCAGDRTLSAEKIAGAEKSIDSAVKSDAAGAAPVELKSAEDNLANAKSAMNSGDYERARRLAESASADADLAQAKASSAKSKRAAADMRESVNSLRKELYQTQSK